MIKLGRSIVSRERERERGEVWKVELPTNARRFNGRSERGRRREGRRVILEKRMNNSSIRILSDPNISLVNPVKRS